MKLEDLNKLPTPFLKGLAAKIDELRAKREEVQELYQAIYEYGAEAKQIIRNRAAQERIERKLQ